MKSHPIRIPDPTNPCRFPGCGLRRVGRRDLCSAHYLQFWRGEELKPLKPLARPLLPNPAMPGTLLVPLTQGYFAIIDEADGPAVGKFNWHVRKAKRKAPMYAQYTRNAPDGRTEVTGLHQFLWQLWGQPDPPEIDHENRDGLDCRRLNLRAATSNDNARNVEKRSHNTSGYKGVSFHKATGKFSAQININAHVTYLGVYPTAEEAARVYDARARQEFGEFARPNFPDTATSPLTKDTPRR